MIYLFLILTGFLSFDKALEKTHPFYVSATTIEQNVQAQQLELTVKIFIDELEKALPNGKELKIGTEKESGETAFLIESYLGKKLNLEVNGKPCQLKLLGKEVDKTDKFTVWCYLYTPAKKIKSLKVTNEIFLDIIPTQTNITHLKLKQPKLEKSYPFRKGYTTETIRI